MATTDKEYFEIGDIDADTKSFFDLTEDGVSFVFNLNFLGTLLPTQEFAKDMVDRKGCSILNISSMNAFTPLTKIPAYSGAKSAISNFTQWLAVHFSKVGVRVNAIAPGFFSTAQNAKLLWNEDGTPTARTGKFFRQRRWADSAKQRSFWARYFSFCPNRRQALSRAWCCLSTEVFQLTAEFKKTKIYRRSRGNGGFLYP